MTDWSKGVEALLARCDRADVKAYDLGNQWGTLTTVEICRALLDGIRQPVLRLDAERCVHCGHTRIMHDVCGEEYLNESGHVQCLCAHFIPASVADQTTDGAK